MKYNMPDTISSPETPHYAKINGMNGHRKRKSPETADYVPSRNTTHGVGMKKNMEATTAEEENNRKLVEHIKNIEQSTQKNKTKPDTATKIWKELGFIQCITRNANPENQTATMLRFRIENCTKTSNNPSNLAKHLAKTHKDKITIKLSRQKVNFPLRNKDYSNAIALLMHLQMTNANMTWKPMQCEIITTKRIPPGMNNIQNKWLLVQEHNSPSNTPEKRKETVQPYMKQLQTFCEQQSKQQLQISKWSPPVQRKQEQKEK